MRRALFALLLVAGCKKADGIVVLTVDASPALASVALLHVSATAAGRTVTFEDHPAAPFTLPPARTLGIEFPASVAGPMRLHIEARDGAGHVLASADSAITTSAGVRSDVRVTFGAGGSGSTDMAGSDGGSGDGGGGGDGSTDLAGPGCVNGDGVCANGCNSTNDSDCPAVCGNGVREAGEVCDDGNSANGDNCDPTCQFTNTLSIAVGKPSGQGRADGLGATARLRGPVGITTDQVMVYFGDDCSVKRYDPTTMVTTTIAGAWGQCSVTDGAAASARFTTISDLEFVPNAGKGVLYIAGNTVLRKLDLGTMMVSSINGVAGEDNGNRGDGLGSSSDGTTLYLIDFVNGLRSVNLSTNGTTVVATAAQLNNDICTDVARFGADLYLACGNLVLKVTPGVTPTVATFAGNTSSGPCLNSTGSDLTTARFSSLNRMVIDNTGTITATDDGCHVVWMITPGVSGSMVAVAGTLNTAGHADSPAAGSATSGTMSAPAGVVTIAGYNYVAETAGASDAFGRTLRGFSSFALTTLAGVPSNGAGVNSIGTNPTFESPFLIMENGNNPLVANFSFSNPATFKLDLTAGSASYYDATHALFGFVLGTTLYTPASSGNGTLTQRPIAGGAESYFAGLAHAGNVTPVDGPFATATMNSQQISASDGTNLYFPDGSGTLIRVVDMVHQKVTTIAGTYMTTNVADGTGPAAHFANAGFMACDGPNLYVTDGTTKQGTLIRKVVIATGKVTTIAGADDVLGQVDGIGAAARFAGAKALATDGHALYITDPGGGANNGSGNGGPPDPYSPLIRELELANNRVTTMVGSLGQWTARVGIGKQGAMNQPFDIVFDAQSHSLLVVDSAEDVVFRIK